MKVRNFMYLVLSVSLMYACTNDDVNIPVANEQESKVSSLDVAKELLEDFVGETYARSSSSFKIKGHKERTVYINNKGGIPTNVREAIPIYEFTTEIDGIEGYSVVVGDERVGKVLISVPQGSLTDTTFIEPLRWYYNDIPLLIEHDLEQYNNGTQEITSLSRMTAETCYRFTSTTWGQDDPYNASCPNQYPAGCAAIAVAQILAYHQVPSDLNWSAILSYPTVNNASGSVAIDQISTLVYNIGVSLESVYNITVTTATYTKVPSVLRSYGLQCGFDIPFTIDDAIYSLQNGGPFIMSAMPSSGNVGHMWVCDGWKRHIYDDSTYYDYFNMNWGWNGNSNGFFLVENPMSFNVGGYLYNKDFEMVYNIRK